MFHKGAKGDSCQCPHHKMIPLFIVLIGLLFLIKAFGAFDAQTVAILWPLLLILIGLQKMFGSACSCCKK